MPHRENTDVRLGYHFLIMILVTQNSVVGFYLNTTIGILQGRLPNISCWLDSDTLAYNTIGTSLFGLPFLYPMSSYGDACIFIKQNGSLLNGSQFNSFLAASLLETNLYRQMTG
jgi:hypothetical protein